MRPLLAVLVLGLTWTPGRCAGAAAHRASVEARPGGGFLVKAPGYRAALGADGNLHSFQVGESNLLDDQVAISLGAFLFAEAPLKLGAMSKLTPTVVQADGESCRIQYQFLRREIRITIFNHQKKPLSYFAVLSPDIVVASNLHTGEEAAAPGRARWRDVRFTAGNGDYVEFVGGSRIWGPWLGRQVWELSKIAPGKWVEIKVKGGHGEPPSPTLEHLVTLRARVNEPNGLAAAGEPVEVKAEVENRADRELSAIVSAQISGCGSDLLQTASRALTLPPRQTASTSFRVKAKEPDFYTAQVTLMVGGKQIASAAAAAGYAVSEIRRTAPRPDDFQAFWDRVLQEAGDGPPPYRLTLDAARSRKGVTTWVMEYQGFGGKPIYGWYLCPGEAGRRPAVLYLSGYGARPVAPPIWLAERGYVVLAIDVRGNRVDVPRPRAFEDYATEGIDSPQTYVYREIVGHCLRGLRVLASSPEVDANRIAVMGVSEGGGLALMLGALAPEVKAVAADAPMFCDFGLSLEAGGWPYSEMARFLRARPKEAARARVTLSYFDLLNFAPRIHCPALVNIGLLDEVSLPTAVFAVYNLMPGPKEINPLPQAGHEGGGDQLWARKLRWLDQVLAAKEGPHPSGAAGEGE